MSTNADQKAFWSDQAGPTWVAQMDAMDAALGPVLDLVLDRAELDVGARVLDIGCGAGTSTLRAAAAAGLEGQALGADISTTLLEVARARGKDLPQAAFDLVDAQTHAFAPAAFDHLISRFGVMFFEDPIAAFANMARALRPGARVTLAAWGPIPGNPYFTMPAGIVKQVLGTMPKSDPDAPGPFAFRDADKVVGILQAAGLENVAVTERELMLTPKGDAEAVATLLCEIGPAQSALTYFEADAAARARLIGALVEGLTPYATPEGLRIPALINLIEAAKPA